MALTDKNIVITPNVGNTSDPKIVFSGANSTSGAQNITLQAYPASNGTLSFEGSAGQLFSITNDLSSTLFSVNDVSGIPSIAVEANGMVSMAPYSGSVVIGPTSESTLTVNSNTTAWIPVFGTSEVAPTSLTSFVIHRHSTAYEPVITGARSNSNTTTHTAVSAGQSLLTMQGAGSAGANGYQLFGSISIGASGTGTIGATSAPGKITFNTTSNNAVSPTAALTLDWDKSATFAGALSGITTAAMGNTTITGFANVTSTIQGGSSLTIAGALSGVTTAAMGNTTITGFANVTSTLQVTGTTTLSGNLTTAGTYKRSAAGIGYLDGNYASIETTSTTGPIYCLSTSYAPTSNTLGGMYGIGYNYGNGGVGYTNTWGMYVASGGVARHFLDSDNGISYASGSHRSPLFYDKDNTSYYIDPASTTTALSLNGNGYILGAAYGGLSIGESPTNYDGWDRQLTLNGTSHARIAAKTATVRNGLYAHDSWNSTYNGTTGAAGQVGTYTNHNLVVITGATPQAHWDTSGNYYIKTSARAPVFYDLDNTGYYVDAASTSYLSAARINKLYFNRVNAAASGISWYNEATYTAWTEYMAAATATSVGPTGTVTAPTGTLVTSWALRSFIESSAGYGWTFESGSATSTTPSVVAEISSATGAARFGGSVRTPVFYDSDNTSYYADLASTSTSINTAGDIVSNSDRNLKENVQPITNAIAKIRMINGVTYNKIGETDRTAGVIAQDVLAVQPELVTQQGQYLSVAYGNMAGLFVEGIKEHDDTIESLKQEVAELKALVKQLLDTK